MTQTAEAENDHPVENHVELEVMEGLDIPAPCPLEGVLAVKCDGKVDACGVCNGPGIPKGHCDCYGHVEDCLGQCGVEPAACKDECGVCNGPGIRWKEGFCDCDMHVKDCFGVCGGHSILDICGVCNGPGILPGRCDCKGRKLDCAGTCGGEKVEDECKVCGGEGVLPG
jgi:hypothetical protein